MRDLNNAVIRELESLIIDVIQDMFFYETLDGNFCVNTDTDDYLCDCKSARFFQHMKVQAESCYDAHMDLLYQINHIPDLGATKKDFTVWIKEYVRLRKGLKPQKLLLQSTVF